MNSVVRKPAVILEVFITQPDPKEPYKIVAYYEDSEAALSAYNSEVDDGNIVEFYQFKTASYEED